MSPKEIKVGHTYVNRGAGRTRRTVLAMSTELPVQWWGNNDEPRGEMVVRFCQQGMRDSTLYLSSFAVWAGKDVTPLEGIGDEQCLQSLIPQTNERSCTHPITLDKHCSQCGANNVEPKIETATPEQWQHRLDDIVEARK